METQSIERKGIHGVVVWLTTVVGLCLALTVGVAVEAGAQTGGTGGWGGPTLDAGKTCAHQPGEKLCKTVSQSTCSTFGLAWAILTGDVENCMEITEYWYWS